MTAKTATVRLLFADEGSFREMDVEVSAEAMEGYPRLIDFLQEDADLLRRVHLDLRRLCAAEVVTG